MGNTPPHHAETREFFVGGERVSASANEYLVTRNPSTTEPIARVAAAAA